MSDTKFLNETIVMICKKLNELNINYYIAGAIGGYIDAGIPLERKHDDLDILIEEKDVEKLKLVFEDTDFNFFDNRFVSEKVLNEYGYTDGDHEVCAWHKFSDFHIGFFLVSFDENSYTISEYFREGKKQKKLDRTLPIEYFKYQYNDTPINFFGIDVKVARKELIYKNKKAMGREKDLFDIERLEGHLDYQILDGLKGLSKKRTSQIIEIESLNDINKNVELRKATINDADFVLDLKRLGMKWYIEKIYGWDENIQKSLTVKELDEHLDGTRIIVKDGKDIGVTTFNKFDDYYEVGLIIVHPSYQGRGIASKLIREYINIAKKDKKKIIIKTYEENPAKKLYERLGFKVCQTDKTHIHFEINSD